MQKILLGLVAALALLAGSAANAETYIQVSGGPTFDPSLEWSGTTYNMNSGYNVGGAIGTTLDSWIGGDWAAQAKVDYIHSTYSCCAPNALNSLAVTGDLIYNFHTPTPFTPYVGAGIGPTETTYHNGVSGDHSSWNFGYEMLVGVDWAAFANISVFGEYRFEGATTATVDTIHHVENKSNNIAFGLRLHL
jgi:opacity protein-like surface antigen